MWWVTLSRYSLSLLYQSLLNCRSLNYSASTSLCLYFYELYMWRSNRNTWFMTLDEWTNLWCLLYIQKNICDVSSFLRIIWDTQNLDVSRNWSCKQSEAISRSEGIFWCHFWGMYWRIFPLGYDKLSTLCVGEQRLTDYILITLATPQIPLSFIISDFRKPHTRSDTSQQKTPFVSDPEKLFFRRVWKEKNPTTYATISSFFEVSSSSSQPC